ncbi:MAG: hypothetical protein AB8B64_05670 [Granulosicoccus sp.]
MNSRDVIRHPGPETVVRKVCAYGDVYRHSVRLSAGRNLMDSVAQLMNGKNCDCALIVLDEVDVGPFDYVIPSYANDEVHAAWYSETYVCQAAQLRNATAIVGRRDGAWWMHCHALWDTEHTTGMGHLLPDKVTLVRDATVTLYAFTGGGFDVALDVETAFPIFHVHGQRKHGTAFIARINPHEDIHTALVDLINEAGFAKACVFGIGSLIGAQFETGEPMKCPISEVLISPGAQWNGSLTLPVHCVDTVNTLFHGTIVRGAAPVLVTFELMVIEQ